MIFLSGFNDPCVKIYDFFEVMSDVGHSVAFLGPWRNFSQAENSCQSFGATLGMGRNRIEMDILLANSHRGYYFRTFHSAISVK
jgi:hypothetical protein